MLMRGVSVLRRTLLASTGGSSSPAYSLSICSSFSSASPRSSYSPASSGVDIDAAGSAADLAGDDLLLNDDDDDDESPDSAASASASASATAIAKAATTPTLLQPRVVVYDGVCHLCHRGVKWVIEADKDRKIKFCCLQSKAAEPYMRLCGVDREDVLRRFLFIEGPNLYHQGSTAALRVLSYLPLPYSALSSLLVVPTPLRDAVYDYIAKRRYDWFGKGDDCLVLQEKELLERFIDREEMMDRSWQDL